MARLKSALITILAKDIDASSKFYEQVADLIVAHRTPASVHLTTQQPESGFALRLIDEVSQLVPKSARGLAGGLYITLVIEDVDNAFHAAAALGAEIIERPHGKSAGSERAIVRDLNGVVLDLVSQEGLENELPKSHIA